MNIIEILSIYCLCLMISEHDDLVGAWGRIPLQEINVYLCIKLLKVWSTSNFGAVFVWDPNLMINIPNPDLASLFWMFRYFLEHELQMACWGFPDSFWANQTDISLPLDQASCMVTNELYATIVSWKMSESFNLGSDWHFRGIHDMFDSELHTVYHLFVTLERSCCHFQWFCVVLLSMPHSSWQDRKILAYTPRKDPGQV